MSLLVRALMPSSRMCCTARAQHTCMLEAASLRMEEGSRASGVGHFPESCRAYRLSTHTRYNKPTLSGPCLSSAKTSKTCHPSTQAVQQGNWRVPTRVTSEIPALLHRIDIGSFGLGLLLVRAGTPEQSPRGQGKAGAQRWKRAQ